MLRNAAEIARSDGTGREPGWLDSPLLYALGAPAMSVLGAVTTLLAPMILDPVAFGAFALMTVLFQNASYFDLGLSQVSDKVLAGEGTMTLVQAEEIVQARWVASLLVGALLLPLASILAIADGHFTPAQAALALGAGLAMMIANGRVIAFRSMSLVREFTVSALLLQAGLTLPRLLGLLLAGVNGCFAALGLWFGTLALALARPGKFDRHRIVMAVRMIRTGLPLFVFGGLWILFTVASRWISSALSGEHDFGLFAFGANLTFIAVITIGTITQVRYPKIIVAFHKSTEEGSRMLGMDVARLTMALSALVAAGILSAGTVIAALFPAFIEAHAATVVIGMSCIPLGIAVWMLPIAIAFSTMPVVQSAGVFGPPLMALALGMTIGNAMNGIVGQAWACIGASVLLVGTLLLHMRRIGILGTGLCRRIVLTLAAFLGACAVLAVLTYNGRAAAATAAEETMPPYGWDLSFSDEFETLELWDGAHGLWEPHYPWGARKNNDELQFYVDPRPGQDAWALAALEPFQVRDGVLYIRADRIPSDLRSAAQGRHYSSGLLTTARSFAFRYGYVEARARIPSGKGFWPALWLIPVDQSWPPEVDILEARGSRPNRYWTTIHHGRPGRPSRMTRRIDTPDLSEDFHVFGMKWTEDHVTWFFDGRPVFRARTPTDMHKPMYVVMNLAVGGRWDGSPNDTTPFPSEFAIDYVRVYTPP